MRSVKKVCGFENGFLVLWWKIIIIGMFRKVAILFCLEDNPNFCEALSGVSQLSIMFDTVRNSVGSRSVS